jgi:hypothetical protein
MRPLRVFTVVALFLLSLNYIYAQNNMPLIAEFQGEHNGASFGYSLVTLDFNHDGYNDLIVLAAGHGWVYPSTPSHGKVYIYYGGPNFSSTTQPAMSLEGDYPNGMQRKIVWILNAGDINGDDYEDLIILDTIPNVSGSARFMYYFGGTDDLLSPDMIITPLPNEDISRLDALGDIDGDGFDDVGIRYFKDGVYCFDIQWGGSYDRLLVCSGPEILSYASFIMGIGDINNDGYHDFTIGYVNDASMPYNVIKLFYGNQNRIFVNPILLVNNLTGITRRCKPIGDLNGDEYDDFFAYACSDGMMIWFGSDVLDPSNPNLALNPVYFGNDVVRGIGAGDFNGDGYSDVVGADCYSQRFAVWLGSPAMNGFADWQKTSSLENFGFDIAVGDYNGDGFDDIAVSAPIEEGIWPYHDFLGYVFIYGGNPGMVANDDILQPSVHQEIQLDLYPNPLFKSNTIFAKLTVSDKIAGNSVSFKIFNQKGQMIYKSEVSQKRPNESISSFDFSAFSSGIYIVQADIDHKRVTRRFTLLK